MKLFLLRHGDAANYRDASCDRPLTPLGIAETRQVIEHCHDAMAGLDAIYCSPKLRARQTADIASELLNGNNKPQIIEQLLPQARPVELESLLNQSADQQILLVTHQPLAGEWINRLTDRSDLGYQMSTSCLACLDVLGFSRGGATLQWLHKP
ncbi:MAG: phosphohistidine phosphatase SixA [Porticoccaceae bacterium]|nr:phosphohistidine phosphatase SixA [Porticoccaceae bacterium]